MTQKVCLVGQFPFDEKMTPEEEQLSKIASQLNKVPKFIKASIDNFDSIRIETTVSLDNAEQNSLGLCLQGAEIKEIKKIPPNPEEKIQTHKVKIITSTPLCITDTYTLSKEGFGEISIQVGNVVHTKEFDELYFYSGNDLGNIYHKDKTSFRVWAPTAKEVNLITYGTWDSMEGTEISMRKDVSGTWACTLNGDKHGLIYNYKVRIGDQWNEAVDPYAKAVIVNGDKGVVVDLTKTNPANWSTKKPELEKPEDAIIYELHVRDLSIQKESGIVNKGKFLGVTELGTKGPGGLSTGLDYIKQLGVTHVQFLPIFDYETVDETKLDQPQYNWGYDPKNYNAPEGSYSTDPYNPTTRITELKQMVQTLHDNGLRVIMDVVYNHVWDIDEHSFNKIVPGYYFRYNEDGTPANGTWVGNDVASERKMVSRYIVDSVTYWAKEYHLDGFRFDLMGILDIETMNKIRAELDKIDPSIIILGEGWHMRTPIPENQKANQKNASNMKRIAQFNDGIRDSVKGNVFSELSKGFINDEPDMEDSVKQGIAGGLHYPESTATFTDPDQVVTYVEAHDNLTLWDKLEVSCPEASFQEKVQMHKLASSIITTSQGILFIHAGQEFMRTKDGNHNSYKSPDSVNQLDWNRRAQLNNEVNYMRGLIELRKAYSSFRMNLMSDIDKRLCFIESPEGTIAFVLDAKANNDPADQIVVIHNANEIKVSIKLPCDAEWKLLVDGNKAGTKILKMIKGGTVEVPSKMSYVLVR